MWLCQHGQVSEDYKVLKDKDPLFFSILLSTVLQLFNVEQKRIFFRLLPSYSTASPKQNIVKLSATMY